VIDRHVIGALSTSDLTGPYGTTPRTGILVNSSCSGADVMALCAAVTLAYPVAWRRRLAGAAIGLGLILALNAVRIASLHAVASDPSVLHLFHVYLWPAVLTIATLAYVFWWIRWSAWRRGLMGG
jgi:exosortase/archaeosortase family protein